MGYSLLKYASVALSLVIMTLFCGAANAEWVLKLQEDKFSSGQVTLSTFDADDPTKGLLGIMCIRLSDGYAPKVVVTVAQPRYLGGSGRELRISYIFDDANPVTTRWEALNKRLAYDPLRIRFKKKQPFLVFDDFLQSMIDSESFDVRLRNYDSESEDNSFDIEGLIDVLPEFLAACYKGRDKETLAINRYIQEIESSATQEQD